MAKRDPAIDAHLEWLGFVRPTGLVVSAPALVRAGAILNTHDREGQDRLAACAVERETATGTAHSLPDFKDFAEKVLDWSFSPRGYAGTDGRPIPDDLKVHLPDFGETLQPDLAVIERSSSEGELAWQLLVRVLDADAAFDAREVVSGSSLDASPHGRMERLLRQTGVHAGLLFNGSALRLISAPRGESSGWLDFQVEEMVQTAGRPICAAMRLLLNERRLLSLPTEERLGALLLDSRKFQNEVSEALAEQVMHALYDLVRGLQAAHDQSKGELLREVLRNDPDEVYRALLTSLLRIVFLLYAEEREMLPSDDVFMRYYSIAGLHERLREDAAHYPDTLDQRYGGWAQLLGLFRMVYDGAELGGVTLPRRHGVLFDPDRFPFLEGRPRAGARQVGERIEPPLVPDGTVYRVLERLLILDGERISYRALDVEQIGSVYETMMGFRLETATGRSLAIRSKARGGAPTTVDLDRLLDVSPGKRRKWLQDRTERKVSRSVNNGLKDATSLEALHAALRPVADRRATPDLVPAGAMILQPSEERRKSGSHYTPRALTEPIVRKTLEPLLARLAEDAGGVATPEQILELKICDPAMGSGAFLVEACRQLGDALLDAWKAGDGVPPLPSDEDEVVFARRRVAQRCLYGVDRNPIAVDLAKVSLWLATLARDHAFTFLDHALRHGDSLVGLSRRQIELFHWDTKSASRKLGIETEKVRDRLDRALELRRQIQDAGEDVADWELRALWGDAELELDQVRLFGDLVIAAYFEGSKSKEREAKRAAYANDVASGTAVSHRAELAEMRSEDPPLVPFHWEVEFPEVFERENGGFDGFVGNPPFLGSVGIGNVSGGGYTRYLRETIPATGGKSDLVAYFFRRSYDLVRWAGTVGLVATKSIRQGDTRESGLEWILTKGSGTIFSATRRLVWPGTASVVVSVVHIVKGRQEGQVVLDGHPVRRISAYLVPGDQDTAPMPIEGGRGGLVAGYGNKPGSSAFVLDPAKGDEPALRRLLSGGPSPCLKLVRPYLIGSELNDKANLEPQRWVIDFGSRRRSEAEECSELLEVLYDRLPESKRENAWWRFAHRALAVRDALEDAQNNEMLVVAEASDTFAFRFIPTTWCPSNSLVVVVTERRDVFSILQSRVHEAWVRGLSLTLKDDLRYVPGIAFDAFPFPDEWDTNTHLEAVGRAYEGFRANLMHLRGEGLTQVYHRINDTTDSEASIVKLRELQANMDRAVLDAYGWTKIPTDCDFFLDYEIDEETWSPRKKKPWRYRWPDEVQDEVLARLLELNRQRAEEERMGAAPATEKKSSAKQANPTATDRSQNELFSE
ncbi:MAG: N-6 DNA methylase [Longimicrobiales bacterium]